MPGDRRTPVMADNDSLLFAKRRHQRDHVADIVEDGVGADVSRRAGPAEPAHIGGNDMETGFGDRSDLVPPGIGEFGPAMAEQHQRTLSLLDNKEVQPVGGNGA